MRALIIDDEKHCRHVLSLLLQKHCPDIEILDECTSGKAALEAIGIHKPDLIFLDIEMPGMNGFEVLEQATHREMAVVFTTAYTEYAIRAIRFSALDYLVKPVDKDELMQAVERARQQRTTAVPEKIEQLLDMLRAPKNNNQLALPTLEGLVMISTDDILYCESNSAYTTFHFTDNKKILISKTLKEVEDVLANRNFYRIHNSYLISMKYISKYVKSGGGEVVMKNGDIIPVSRMKKQEFLSLLDKI